MSTKKFRIGIVGFGYVGLIAGAALARRGHDVVGIDVNETVTRRINAGECPIYEPGLDRMVADTVAEGNLRATTDIAEVSSREVILITVGTPLGADTDADLEALETALASLSRHLRDGQLLILKSTVPPGTTERLVPPILTGKAVAFAFCPERISEGSGVTEFGKLPIVVGGIDSASSAIACDFWKQALGVDVIQVRSPTAAEMVKLADNLWIDLNIALANEIAMLCDSMEIDALEVIAAANSLPKGQHHVNILFPSIGVGGSCLIKDPWFIHALGQARGLDLRTPVTSRSVNADMPEYSAALIERLVLAEGRSPADCRIAVLGLAFKNDTGDCRSTPAKPALEALERRGFTVSLFDPLVSPEEARATTAVALSPDWQTAVRDADCIAFFTGHKAFREIPLEDLADLARPGALIFDGRMYFDRAAITRMQALGLRFKGVGR